MEAALRAVAGVSDVGEHDHESWAVNGTPSGEDLAKAAAAVLDGIADQLSAGMRG